MKLSRLDRMIKNRLYKEKKCTCSICIEIEKYQKAVYELTKEGKNQK